MYTNQYLKYISLCLWLLLSFTGFSQQKDYVEVKANIVVEDGKLDGTTLDIETNGKTSQHFEISRDSRFVYRLKFNNEYKITFSKPGLYTRIISISTLVPKAILDKNSDFPSIDFQVNLLKEIENVDKSFSFRPYARIFYNEKIDDFDYELNLDENMFAFQLDQAFAQEQKINKEQKSLDKLELQELQEMQKEFDRIIKEADNFFDQTRYDEALAKYQEASKLFPERPYPLDRIREIQNVLDALKLAELKKQDINKQYREAIDRADAKYKEKIYGDALNIYRQAMQYKPEDNYAQRRINEIEKILIQQENERKFAETLAQAENLFNNKEYQQAREIFRAAAEILPDDPRPNARIDEINRILQSIAQQTANEENYRLAIQEGDRLFEQQKYTEAIAEYRKALDIKPEDPNAQEKIRNAEKAIKQLEEQQVYNTAIAEADKAFKKKDYEVAEAAYSKALAVKPLEKYPQNQIDQIKNILATAKAEKLKGQQYDSLIHSGDSLFNARELETAKIAFTKALELSPGQSYPNRMILQINRELEALATEKVRQQQIEQSYTQAIVKADQAFGNKQYNEAKRAYNEALDIKPNESYPANQIEEIDRILQSIAEQTEKQQNYQHAIQLGDQLSEQQKYAEAITEYRKALEIKPEDTIARDKIMNAETAKKKLEEQQTYDALITEADKAFKKKEYESAESGYRAALEMRPPEKYPKDQINLIRNILATAEAEKLKEQQYDSLIRSGDSLFNAKELEMAKAAFTSALELSPGQNYPSRMILQINRELETLAAEEAHRQQIEKLYNQAISKADLAFMNKQYEEAKQVYNEALGFKPNENYPSEKIAEINRLLQEEKEKVYQQAITEGDDLFNQKNYTESIDQYRKALQIKNGDTYATEKIAEATRLSEELEKENVRLKKLEDDYSRLLSQAEDASKRNDLIREKEKLTEALELKPEEIYPKTRIAKIDDILEKQRIAEENERLYAENMKVGQKAFNDDRLEEAKSAFEKALTYKAGETLALQRIEEINRILEQRAEIERMTKLEEEQRLAAEKANREKYNQAITEGDANFNIKKYNEARSHYISAISAVPGEQYPKDQIKKIDNILDELMLQSEVARQQAIRDSINEVRIQNYQLLFQQAEQLASQKKYEDAIAKLNDALDILPDRRSEVNAKISEIKDLMRIAEKQMNDYKSAITQADELFNSGKYTEASSLYVDAGNIMPDEKYPKSQLKKIQDLLAAKDADYAAVIARADKFFKTEKWQSAKNSYIEALDIKPNDEYATAQLNKINQHIAQMLAADIEESLTKKAYSDMLKQAEESLASGKLKEAKHLFEISKTLIPGETYPDQKIQEIDKLIIIAKEDSLKLAQTKNEDDRYRQVIALADQAFRNKTFDEAIRYYTNALQIKPGETYPQKQIDTINEMSGKQQAVSENKLNTTDKQEVIALDTEPSKNTSEYQGTSPRYLENLNITETNKLYDEAIKKADDMFNVKDYSVARFYYYKASDIKPSEDYPKHRIEEIGRLIDDGLSSEIRTAYDDAIKQADDAFAKTNYTVAKFYYYKALEQKSWERYPKNRIHEIQMLTNSLLSEREEKLFNEAIAQADEAYYAKNYSVARFHYNEAVRINPNERYPKIKLDDIKKLIEQEKRDQIKLEYMNQLQQADKAFEQGDYSVARFYYNKAISIVKTEQYPKDQLQRIEEILSKKRK